jgi:hypothetical protein
LLTWVYGLLWLMTPFEASGTSPGQRLLDWVNRLFAPPAPDSRPREDGR